MPPPPHTRFINPQPQFDAMVDEIVRKYSRSQQVEIAPAPQSQFAWLDDARSRVSWDSGGVDSGLSTMRGQELSDFLDTQPEAIPDRVGQVPGWTGEDIARSRFEALPPEKRPADFDPGSVNVGGFGGGAADRIALSVVGPLIEPMQVPFRAYGDLMDRLGFKASPGDFDIAEILGAPLAETQARVPSEGNVEAGARAVGGVAGTVGSFFTPSIPGTAATKLSRLLGQFGGKVLGRVGREAGKFSGGLMGWTAGMDVPELIEGKKKAAEYAIDAVSAPVDFVTSAATGVGETASTIYDIEKSGRGFTPQDIDQIGRNLTPLAFLGLAARSHLSRKGAIADLQRAKDSGEMDPRTADEAIAAVAGAEAGNKGEAAETAKSQAGELFNELQRRAAAKQAETAAGGKEKTDALEERPTAEVGTQQVRPEGPGRQEEGRGVGPGEQGQEVAEAKPQEGVVDLSASNKVRDRAAELEEMGEPMSIEAAKIIRQMADTADLGAEDNQVTLPAVLQIEKVVKKNPAAAKVLTEELQRARDTLFPILEPIKTVTPAEPVTLPSEKVEPEKPTPEPTTEVPRPEAEAVAKEPLPVEKPTAKPPGEAEAAGEAKESPDVVERDITLGTLGARGFSANEKAALKEMGKDIKAVAREEAMKTVGIGEGIVRGIAERAAKADTYIKLVARGGEGKETANRLNADTRQVTYDARVNFGKAQSDVRNLLKASGVRGTNHLENLLWAGDHPKDFAKLSVEDQAIVTKLREIRDREIEELAKAGFKREGMDISGSGRFTPQLGNVRWRNLISRMERDGLADPEVRKVAEHQVAEGLADSAEGAVEKILDHENRRALGYNPYFESVRTYDMPRYYRDLNPRRVLFDSMEKNWLWVEAVKKWGPTTDLPQLRSNINKLGAHRGVAEQIMDYYKTMLGMPGGDPKVSALANAILKYEFVSKLAWNATFPIREVWQYAVNSPWASSWEKVKTMAKYPPIVNRFMSSARQMREEVDRAGLDLGASYEIEHYNTTMGKIGRLLTAVPRVASHGTNIRLAILAKMSVQRKFDKLMGLAKGGELRRMLASATSLRGESLEQLIRQVRESQVKEMSIKELADAIQRGTLTADQLRQAQFMAIRNAQFPMLLGTMPVQYALSPWTRVLLQYKPFSFRQTGLVYKDVVKQALKGNGLPLARYLTWSAIASQGIALTLDALFGTDRAAATEVKENGLTDDALWKFLSNWVYGGGVGLLTDMVYDWSQALSPPVLTSLMHVAETTEDIVKNPAQRVDALKRFVRREFPGLVKGEMLIRRGQEVIGGVPNKPSEYSEVRSNARREVGTMTPGKRPEKMGIGQQAVAKAKGFFSRPEVFQRGPRTTSLDAAKQAIDKGDLSAATQSLINSARAEPTRTPKERFRILKQGLKDRSPLGGMNKAQLNLYLRTLPKEERTKLIREQQKWLRSAYRALNNKDVIKALREK